MCLRYSVPVGEKKNFLSVCGQRQSGATETTEVDKMVRLFNWRHSVFRRHSVFLKTFSFLKKFSFLKTFSFFKTIRYEQSHGAEKHAIKVWRDYLRETRPGDTKQGVRKEKRNDFLAVDKRRKWRETYSCTKLCRWLFLQFFFLPLRIICITCFSKRRTVNKVMVKKLTDSSKQIQG